MLIQPNINPNYYSNYRVSRNNNPVSFKSANGARVLNQITKNNIRSKAGITELLKKLGFGTLGMISLAQVAEILEEIPNEFAIMKNETDAKMYEHDEELKAQRQEFEDEKRIAKENFENEKQTASAELESQKQAFADEMKTAQEELESQKQTFVQDKKNAEDKLETDRQTFANKMKTAQEELETQKQAFAQDKKNAEDKLETARQTFEQYKTAKEEEIRTREETVKVGECTLNKPERDRIISATRALYGLKDTELKSYDSYAEQLEGLNSLLSKQKDRVKTQDADALQSIVKTMQNKEGIVSNEMMKFVENIFSASEEVYVNELQVVIALAKDSLGNLDTEKAAAIVSELKTNTDNNSIKSLINNIYSVSDLKDVVINSEDMDKYNELQAELKKLMQEKNNINQSMDSKTKECNKIIRYTNSTNGDDDIFSLDYTFKRYNECQTSLESYYEKIATLKQDIAILNQSYESNPLNIRNLLGEEDFKEYVRLSCYLETAKEKRKNIEQCKKNIMDWCNYLLNHINPRISEARKEMFRTKINNRMDYAKTFQPSIDELSQQISQAESKLASLKLKTTNGDTAITKLSDKVEITKKESEDCCDGESLGVLLLKSLFSCCGDSSCSSKSSSHSSYSSSYSSYSCSSGSSDKSASDDTPKADNSNNLDSKKLQVFRRLGSSGYLPQESDFERAGVKLNETEKEELRMRHIQKEQSYRDYLKRSTEPGYNPRGWDDDTHY